MEPDAQRRLETHLSSLSDAELRRIATLEREQYRDDAFEIVLGELARRRLPKLQPEEYWAQFRNEWLAQVGFCYQCWAATTSDPLPGGTTSRLVGMRLVEEGEPCPTCGSTLATNCFCIIFPIVRTAQFRILADPRPFADPPKTRRIKGPVGRVQQVIG
jgi:hypothetical protein